jgi:hypothetical protein
MHIVRLIQIAFVSMVLFLFTASVGNAQPAVQSAGFSDGVPPVLHDQWRILPDGSILLDADSSGQYEDHIEMSGARASLWVQYAIDTARHLRLRRTIVFPSFRMKPNDTHASMMCTFTDSELPRFFIEGRPLHPGVINGAVYNDADDRVRTIQHNGIMYIRSSLSFKKSNRTYSIGITRKLFPSTLRPFALEAIIFRNEGSTPVRVSMEYLSRIIRTDSASSYPQPHYIIESALNPGTILLQPADSVQFAVAYSASETPTPQTAIDIASEEAARASRMRSFGRQLQLVTPDTVLNTAFAFAKRRIGESIYITKAGPMMCPGGLNYYAAIWANDEAEYANPFYPFTGDSLGNAAAVNTYMMFAKYINEAYKPLPSSIIAEGEGIWAGAGDRGDAAMIAYGASRFCLAYGDADTARKLWPLIEWCLEYCKRQQNAEGVIASDHDELEGRFPAGKANLNTSCLYYDALLSAASLGKQLQLPSAQLAGYDQAAAALRIAIEQYFGADMKGFRTYRYYKENTLLRSWICVPLTMGIYDRAQGTVEALFSPALFSPQGLLTEEGNNTFWDRSTLYALRGIFAVGQVDKALSFLTYYSHRRLLGNHVPYPVEAYPEGGQRHLAAESALYCRVFTEGVFGIRPTGFHSFTCTPRLPAAWNSMALKHIRAFDNDIDIEVTRKAQRLMVTIKTAAGRSITRTIKDGDTLPVDAQLIFSPSIHPAHSRSRDN